MKKGHHPQSSGKGFGGIDNRLDAPERLRVLQRLGGEHRSLNPSILKNVSAALLRSLTQGEDFDLIHIDVVKNNPKSLYEVVIELERNGKVLPRAISGFVTYKGEVASIMEADVSKRPFNSEISSIGLEADASCFDFEDPAAYASGQHSLSELKSREAALLRFDTFLRIAANSMTWNSLN